MKDLLIIGFLAMLFSCQPKSYTTGIEPKNMILNSEMNISKVVIEGDDRSNKLETIRITDRQWSEYDKSGNVIGVASVVAINNKTIEIKWNMAENGADVGENTVYEYHILDDKVLFTIWKGKTQKGYFEARLGKSKGGKG